MTIDQILLLGSILVPALVSIALFSGLIEKDDLAKQLAFLGFGFPCIAGIVLFINFDGSQEGYCFEMLYEEMGLQELGITFHLGLNGVSSPLFAWLVSSVWLPVWPPSGPVPSGSSSILLCSVSCSLD